MAEITASMVRDLRDKTDAPMMECKRALVEAQGNSDRKSTRLNSSHLVISYAVFCLKKKNMALDRSSLTAQFLGRRLHRFAWQPHARQSAAAGYPAGHFLNWTRHFQPACTKAPNPIP